jgi:hypothetical protein
MVGFSSRSRVFNSSASPRATGQVLRAAEGGGAAHPGQVCPGAEGFSAARQQDDPNLVVGFEVTQFVHQIDDQRVVEGVVDLGTVDGQKSPAGGIDFAEEGGFGHVLTS